jgi:cytochrome bd-type quinol oxidase subunit 1
LLAGLALLIALVAVVRISTYVNEREGYRSPMGQTTESWTPRAQSQADEAEAEAKARLERPYEEAVYRPFPRVGSRVAIWVVAQLHLLFAAFVLAVPLFALTIEFIGYFSGDTRYDKLAHEFTKLLSISFSFTASFGAGLVGMLLALYPHLTNYMAHVFSPTFLPYVSLFFLEAIFLYSYYYGWGKFSPRVHLFLGVMLNITGLSIMFIANAWLTFMTSPAGLSEAGAVVSTWDAINNFTWMPMNIHRTIGNVCFGGSVASAYAAYRFLSTTDPGERAHYDWMGYVGLFVSICAFLPLPFAGYWLTAEMYEFSQTLGLVMMGGAFSWLFIIQALLIGIIFLAVNYYLWLGMDRIAGAERYQKFIKYLLIVIAVCFAVWATPRSVIATVTEIRAMGGAAHPALGYLGVMSAKNTAVNVLILTTFVSFLLYRRSGKIATVSWARAGNAVQFAIFAVAVLINLFLGVYGYFVEATVRISFSVPQVVSVLAAMVLVSIVDIFMFRKAKPIGETSWGRISEMSQYTLIFIAISLTWLMGLMGYVRAGVRQHWHVYGVIEDKSVDAFTPTIGFAAQVTSVTVLIFFALVGIVFWLSSLSGAKDWKAPAPAKDRH